MLPIAFLQFALAGAESLVVLRALRTAVLNSFALSAGSRDFAKNVLANSFARSSGVIAQLPSARSRAGMFSEELALVGRVLAIFHQPREEGFIISSVSQVLLTYSWKVCRNDAEQASRAAL